MAILVQSRTMKATPPTPATSSGARTIARSSEIENTSAVATTRATQAAAERTIARRLTPPTLAVAALGALARAQREQREHGAGKREPERGQHCGLRRREAEQDERQDEQHGRAGEHGLGDPPDRLASDRRQPVILLVGLPELV